MNSILNPDTQIFIVLLGIAYFGLSFFNIALGLVLMAISMLFSPEIMIGWSQNSQPIVIRIEDLLIPVLALAWISKIAIQRDLKLVVASPLNKPIFFLLIVSIISSLWGGLTGWVYLMDATFYFLKTLEYFFIFYLVLNYVQSEKQVRFFLAFILLTVVLIGFYTIMQVPSTRMWTEHRISAPFERDRPEPATMGGYMTFLWLIIASIFLYERKIILKWLYGFMLVLIFIPLLFTFNRTSYVALLFGIVFLAIVSKRNWLRIFVLCLVLSAPFWVPDSVKNRVSFTWEDASNPGRELGVDSSFQERLLTIPKAINTWKYSPLIGWGLTSFPTADCQWARTLHEVGIVGLGLWIWMFRRLYTVSWWIFQTEEHGIYKGMALGYIAGLSALIIHGFGNITFYIIRIMEPFWFVTGLMVALYLIKVKKITYSRTV